MKNLLLVSVLATACFACSNDEATPEAPSDGGKDRSTEQQTPNIEPQAPSQEAPRSRSEQCGAPDTYGDLGDRGVVPARITIGEVPRQPGEYWAATALTFPLSNPGEKPDVLVLALFGGHGGVPLLPEAGSYALVEDPLAKDADAGVGGMLFVDIDQKQGPLTTFVPVGGTLTIDEVDALGKSGEAYITGSIENLTFKEITASRQGASYVEGGCTTTLGKLTFDVEVVPTPDSIEVPEPKREGEPAAPPPPVEQTDPTLEGEPAVPQGVPGTVIPEGEPAPAPAEPRETPVTEPS